MAERKTAPKKQSVSAFLDSVEHDTRRKDAKTVNKLMKDATGEKAVMWGDTIVGFGRKHYLDGSGKKTSFFDVGFSPRKASMTLYVIQGGDDESALLAKLGKHKTSKACLYINKLDDVDLDVLTQLIALSYEKQRALDIGPE